MIREIDKYQLAQSGVSPSSRRCCVKRNVSEEIQELGTWEGTSASQQRPMREKRIAKKEKDKIIAAEGKGASHTNIESELSRIGRNE